MKPLIHLTHALLFAVSIYQSPLPPLEQVVVEHMEAVELVTVPEGSPQVYFIDRIQGRIDYVDFRWFNDSEPPLIEHVAGEWRMFFWDRRDDCYRVIYAKNWLVTHCRTWEETPKRQLDNLANAGFWQPLGLSEPKGRWW